MTRVVVTGGSGKLGRAVVREFDAHGYDVVLLDRVPSPDKPDAVAFVHIDLTDYGQVLGAFIGLDDRYDHVDAIVHLAAVPAPGLVPDVALITNNVTASINVFHAARAAGIRNVVWASSETLLGIPMGEHQPPYLPVDEEFPVRPQSSYSLGKAIEEEMARHFTSWDPALKMFALRFSNVMDETDYPAYPWDATPEAKIFNLWSYIDSRDGAQAVRKAVESDLTGFEAFVIVSPDTVMDTPTIELVERFVPDIPRTSAIDGVSSLLSSEKARELLGYDPQHSWRDGR
jgi:nucleoside-diphosphate-sugar epimerase